MSERLTHLARQIPGVDLCLVGLPSLFFEEAQNDSQQYSTVVVFSLAKVTRVVKVRK